MSDKIYNVLFICTGNSARSVMSEGLLAVLGKGRFRTFSAGSKPNGRVNPHAIALLDEIGYDTSALRSKSWTEFEGPDAPQMDIIITVCGNAAGEVCPIWPGHPSTAHWGYEDPHGETEEEKRASFEKIFAQIKQRTEAFLALPEEALAPEQIRATLGRLGEMSF
ncbi:arsenate reductase ArsC [Uliginosibacterium aquaticum]|uniref:Arsenate reductase ArsC n=1 Tax=Uliginosibacterium aquaticum TaxID=2731212 RepID=A0ABX2INL9_9RHOO|nr:arsenate reductase ArsC [Uliginosibacterium aquaticum]NSL55710.1 arsenate reductase ArsC [Uliginosibacterium aquaticum]